MGAWEILIALFGGTWYVISAISAAKAKKKKQEQRRMALAGESPTKSKETKGRDTDTRLQRPEEATASLLETPALRQSTVQAGPASAAPLKASGSADVKMLKDARKAILQAMRKEMGLPSSQPTPRPTAPAGPTTQTASLAVPAGQVEPPPPIEPPKPPRRRRPDPPVAAAAGPRRVGRKSRRAAAEPTSGQSLREVLSRRSSIQQAIVLTELLAKPVSLRENHLSG